MELLKAAARSFQPRRFFFFFFWGGGGGLGFRVLGFKVFSVEGLGVQGSGFGGQKGGSKGPKGSEGFYRGLRICFQGLQGFVFKVALGLLGLHTLGRRDPSVLRLGSRNPCEPCTRNPLSSGTVPDGKSLRTIRRGSTTTTTTTTTKTTQAMHSLARNLINTNPEIQQ